MPENIVELGLALLIAGVGIAIPVLLAMLILDLANRAGKRRNK